jgi:hypothetical protein
MFQKRTRDKKKYLYWRKMEARGEKNSNEE